MNASRRFAECSSSTFRVIAGADQSARHECVSLLKVGRRRMHRTWSPIGQCTSAPAASIDMTSSAVCPAMPGVWPKARWDVDARQIVQRPGAAAASDPHGDLTSYAAITRSDTDCITYED